MTNIGSGNSLAAQNALVAAARKPVHPAKDSAEFLASLEPGTTKLAPVSATKTAAKTSPVAAMTSFYTQAIAQGNSTTATPALTQSAAQTAQDKFLHYAEESPMQRMRDQILSQMNLSEDQIKQMPADQQAKIETQIKEKIREELQKKMGASGASPDATTTASADMAASL